MLSSKLRIGVVAVCVLIGAVLSTASAQAIVELKPVKMTPSCLNLLRAEISGPPTLSAESVANITNNQATVEFTVSPNCYSTYRDIEFWGSGSTTGVVSIGSEASRPESFTFSDLQEGTTYEYRVHAWSSDGVAWGPILAFHTAGKPIITHPQSITGTGEAVFQAAVDPNLPAWGRYLGPGSIEWLDIPVAGTDNVAFQVEYYLNQGCAPGDPNEPCTNTVYKLPYESLAVNGQKVCTDGVCPAADIHGTNFVDFMPGSLTGTEELGTTNIVNGLVPWGEYYFRIGASNLWASAESNWAFLEAPVA